MRERLAISFAIVMLLLVGGAGVVRGYALDGTLRERASEDVVIDAGVIAQLISERAISGRAIDQQQIDELTGSDAHVQVAFDDGRILRSTGADFRKPGSVAATVPMDVGALTVARSPETARRAWAGGWSSIVLLVVMLTGIAALTGYLLARYLSAPFRQLATAAAALGRGRFDLDLPTSSVPEARSIARALESSASQLRDRIGRERQFALHTSHELRTLLTRLRFELEELGDSDQESSSVQRAAETCLLSVDQLNAVAGELVEISRRGSLVAGSEIPLRDLATQTAQVWADRLVGGNRAVSAAVEGEMELLLTPGPVEQVLDLLLSDVVRYSDGDVRLTFEGAIDSIRVQVRCLHTSGTTHDSIEMVSQAKAVVETLGGRFDTVEDGHQITVLLPRR